MTQASEAPTDPIGFWVPRPEVAPSMSTKGRHQARPAPDLPFWHRWWFWALVVLMVAIVMGNMTKAPAIESPGPLPSTSCTIPSGVPVQPLQQLPAG